MLCKGGGASIIVDSTYSGYFRLNAERLNYSVKVHLPLKECARRGSNPQPLAPEANALSN